MNDLQLSPEQRKQLENMRPALEQTVVMFHIIEELVKRQFGVCADPLVNVARAQAVMSAFAVERHAIYTQRVAYVALPIDSPPGQANGSSGKPS
jgi:hypothetical protein